ncbi:MAG: SH3 domain-containing protein [Promethearchaeota archaeon]
MKGKYCKVIKEYKTPFPDPLKIEKDEYVQIEERESEWPGWIWCITKIGKEGWVPKSYLEIQEINAKLLQNYDATELSVMVGEEFMIEDEESGWFWVTNEQGKKGWIPIENVKIIK